MPLDDLFEYPAINIFPFLILIFSIYIATRWRKESSPKTASHFLLPREARRTALWTCHSGI